MFQNTLIFVLKYIIETKQYIYQFQINIRTKSD